MLGTVYDRVRWSALVLALVALSPVPLNIPSGIALAIFACAGAVALMSRRPMPERGAA